MWQFLSGGAEDSETPIQAARREMLEEAGIASDREIIQLDSRASIPRDVYAESVHWAADIFMVSEYSFAVRVDNSEIRLSAEHDEFLWLPYQAAFDILRWDSNPVALWELNERLHQQPA